jgi:hypothetical protein
MPGERAKQGGTNGYDCKVVIYFHGIEINGRFG